MSGLDENIRASIEDGIIGVFQGVIPKESLISKPGLFKKIQETHT